jgi:hypothetical protein
LAPTEPSIATNTPRPSLNPKVDCGGPRYRLNVDKLGEQPSMAGAELSVVDEYSVRIVLQGEEFIITGWGEVVDIGGPGNPKPELLHLLSSAIDAVLFEC